MKSQLLRASTLVAVIIAAQALLPPKPRPQKITRRVWEKLKKENARSREELAALREKGILRSWPAKWQRCPAFSPVRPPGHILDRSPQNPCRETADTSPAPDAG